MHIMCIVHVCALYTHIHIYKYTYTRTYISCFDVYKVTKSSGFIITIKAWPHYSQKVATLIISIRYAEMKIMIRQSSYIS